MPFHDYLLKILQKLRNDVEKYVKTVQKPLKITWNWVKIFLWSEQISPCGSKDRQIYIHRLGMYCLVIGWNTLPLPWNALYTESRYIPNFNFLAQCGGDIRAEEFLSKVRKEKTPQMSLLNWPRRLLLVMLRNVRLPIDQLQKGTIFTNLAP